MLKIIYLYLFIYIIYKEKLTTKKTYLLSTIIFFILDYIFSIIVINPILSNYLHSIIYLKILLNKNNINYYLISIISLPGLLLISTPQISILYLIILFLLKKQIVKVINYLNNKKKILLSILAIIYIINLLILLQQKPSIEIVTNTTIILLLNILIIINTEKTIKLDNLTTKYQELKLYSKTNDNLVTDYRSLMHENKNQLLIIKSMLKGNKKDLEKYIDNLLNNKNTISNRYLNNLRYIPIPGVKNFVNYKLVQLDNIKSTIEIYISKELERINLSKIDIINLDNFYTIIGILLDNIIEELKEQEEKLVSINVYMEGNTTNIELANTYKNYIDINKINMYGYTTKGKEHGVGLYIVNKIIKNNKIFELNTKVDNQFFVQHLKIHHPKRHLK